MIPSQSSASQRLAKYNCHVMYSLISSILPYLSIGEVIVCVFKAYRLKDVLPVIPL